MEGTEQHSLSPIPPSEPANDATVTVARSSWQTAAAAPPEPHPALTHWGSLELRELVGRGGFGEVYRAFDPQLDREVALKLLFARGSGSSSLNATLEHEGRLLAKLRHPNIVTVFGLNHHEGRVGLWMEFLRGRTLDQIVAAQGRFGAREAAAIVSDVCRATAAVHAAGLIHRDIKAQNVIREEGGRIVLTDFGLGQRSINELDSGTAGTPAYMAPELFEGAQGSPRTDTYALGVLLFYLVTAEYPVSASGFGGYADAHRAGRQRLLADLRPDLPDRFTRIADRAVDPVPSTRFETAGRLLAELSEFLTEASRSDTYPSVAGEPVAPAARATSAPTLSRRAALGYGGGAAAATAAGIGWWTARPPSSPEIATNSIVVVPFEDLTRHPGDEYLADGITEELINTLTKSELRVVARTSAFRLKGTQMEPAQIGRQLGVDALLTGSVRRRADRVYVTAQLVKASSGFQIWSESYEQSAADALSIELEISRRVAASLRANLLQTSSSGGASAQRSGNWQAHNAYAQGRFHAVRRTVPSLRTAIGFYESALKQDPGYALAYVGLADAYAYLGVLQTATPDLVARVKDLVGKALKLDDSLSEAYTTLGMVAHLYDWDAVAAEAHFKRALQRSQTQSEARRHYAGLLINLERIAEARSELDLALTLDPLSVLLQLSLTLVDYLDRKFAPGVQRVTRLIESDPNIPHAYQLAGLFQLEQGRKREAIASFRQSVEVSHNNLSFKAYLGWVLGVAGQTRESRAILDEVLAAAKGDAADPLDVATVHAGLGENGEALDWIAKGIARRSPNAVQLLVRPTWRSLRASPRFWSLLHEVPLFKNVPASAPRLG